MTVSKRKTHLAKKKRDNINRVAVFSAIIIGVFVFVYILGNKSFWNSTADGNQQAATVGNIAFDIEAKLRFWDKNNEPVADFWVEIADDSYSREKGLMYRHYIPDTVGMLFIFSDEDNRFFWMKNTPSSLDIIYADQDFQIVSLHQNTPPYSLSTIPSGDKAKYVIELKAGTVARYQLSKGYKFDYSVLK